jgi:hypothetical protein
MMLFGELKGLDLKRLSCSESGRVKEKSRLLGPPFCSQVGGKPGCEKITA